MMIKKIIILNISLMLTFFMATADEMVNEKLKLSLSMPKKVFLGENVNLIVSLKSEVEKSIFSLDTADLVITIQDINNSGKEYVCNRGRLRVIPLQGVIGGEETINVKKQKVKIRSNDELAVTINSLKDFNAFFDNGEYTVKAVYEGKVMANTKFSVVVDYEKTIPALINFLLSSDEFIRMWARKHLFDIIKKPTWIPSNTDTKEQIELEVKTLRKWWDENKEFVLFELNEKEAFRLIEVLKSSKNTLLKEEKITVDSEEFKAVERLGELKNKSAIPILIELMCVRDSKFSLISNELQIDFDHFPFAVALSNLGEDISESLFKEIASSDIKTIRFQLSCLILQKAMDQKKAIELLEKSIAIGKKDEVIKYLKKDLKDWHVRECSDYK